MAESGIAYSALQLAHLKTTLSILAAAVSGATREDGVAMPVAKLAEVVVLPEPSLIIPEKPVAAVADDTVSVPILAVEAEIASEDLVAVSAEPVISLQAHVSEPVYCITDVETTSALAAARFFVNLPWQGDQVSTGAVTQPSVANQVSETYFRKLPWQGDQTSLDTATLPTTANQISGVYFRKLPWHSGQASSGTATRPTTANQISGAYFRKLPWHGRSFEAELEPSAMLDGLSTLSVLATQTAIQAAARQYAKKSITASSGARRFFSTLPWSTKTPAP